MEKIFTNRFKEKIAEKELIEITNKIIQLSDKEIDNLWFKSGFIIKDHEKNNQALRQVDITNFRASFGNSKKMVKNLLLETKIDEVKKNIK